MRLLPLLLALLCALPLTAQSPQAETLLDRNGERMRGTPLALGRNNALGETRAAVRNPDWWTALDSFDLNTVRLCWVGPWYDTQNFGRAWTVDEVLPWIDDAVDNAEAAGLNLILNYHGLNEYGEAKGDPNRTGFGRMTEFWRKAAPRYGDRDFVYYELNNEQSFNGDDYFDQAMQDTMRRVYEMVHELAPERHIILFSFNSLLLPMQRIIDTYDWIDYDYTTIGFHMYGWFQANRRDGERNLEALVAGQYPLICTEWDVRQEFNYVVPYYDQQVMAQPLERFGISWTDWRDWGDATNDQYTDVIVPDARAQGYWWGDPVGVRGAGPALALHAYPNPVLDALTVRVPQELSGKVTLRIIDQLGRVVRTEERRVPGGGALVVGVGDLPRGNYVLRLEGAGQWGVVRLARG